jgi:hypothetical protein
MRMKLEREFYIPRESQGRTNIEMTTAEDAVIYTYITTRGQLGAMAFHGKAAKPDWHFSFTNEAQRQKKVAEYIDGRKRRAQMMAELKADRSKPHALTVGTILVCSWGYDQTNIDYYQVTRVIGPHSVEIRQIRAKSGPEQGFMTAYCTPDRDNFKGEPMVKRSNSTNSVCIASYASASPWDGKPDRYSWYA